MTRTVVFLLMTSSAGMAQWLAVGAKLGGRLTGDVEGYAESESKRYVVGPSVEALLPHGFGVEFSPLYSRFGYRSASSDILGSSYYTRVRADVWEFPIVVKKRLGPVYGLAGYAARRMAGEFNTSGVFALGGPPAWRDISGESRFETSHGVVAGGGVEIGKGCFRIAPEVRYTRWDRDPINAFGSRGFYIAGPQNEVKLLLGLSWRRIG